MCVLLPPPDDAARSIALQAKSRLLTEKENYLHFRIYGNRAATHGEYEKVSRIQFSESETCTWRLRSRRVGVSVTAVRSPIRVR